MDSIAVAGKHFPKDAWCYGHQILCEVPVSAEQTVQSFWLPPSRQEASTCLCTENVHRGRSLVPLHQSVPVSVVFRDPTLYWLQSKEEWGPVCGGVAVKHFVQRVWPPLKRYNRFGQSIPQHQSSVRGWKTEKEKKKEKRKKKKKKEVKGHKNNEEKYPQAGTENRGIRLKRNWKWSDQNLSRCPGIQDEKLKKLVILFSNAGGLKCFVFNSTNNNNSNNINTQHWTTSLSSNFHLYSKLLQRN